MYWNINISLRRLFGSELTSSFVWKLWLFLNLMHRMEYFPYPLDLFHVLKRAQTKRLEGGGLEIIQKKKVIGQVFCLSHSECAHGISSIPVERTGTSMGGPLDPSLWMSLFLTTRCWMSKNHKLKLHHQVFFFKNHMFSKPTRTD